MTKKVLFEVRELSTDPAFQVVEDDNGVLQTHYGATYANPTPQYVGAKYTLNGSGAVVGLNDPTGSNPYGFAVLPTDINGHVTANVNHRTGDLAYLAGLTDGGVGELAVLSNTHGLVTYNPSGKPAVFGGVAPIAVYEPIDDAAANAAISTGVSVVVGLLNENGSCPYMRVINGNTIEIDADVLQSIVTSTGGSGFYFTIEAACRFAAQAALGSLGATGTCVTTAGSAVVTFTAGGVAPTVGNIVGGTGIPIGARIATVDSSTQVTLDVYAHTTASGVSASLYDHKKSAYRSLGVYVDASEGGTFPVYTEGSVTSSGVGYDFPLPQVSNGMLRIPPTTIYAAGNFKTRIQLKVRQDSAAALACLFAYIRVKLYAHTTRT